MKALIAGAGIAGPATAIALRKAGIAAVLYEAYPEDATDAGAFVTIAANGQDALHAIGAYDPVHEASFPASRMRIFDPAGSQVADIPPRPRPPGPAHHHQLPAGLGPPPGSIRPRRPGRVRQAAHHRSKNG
jgi:2-polyprenyl-6-methoxyphenol hydroxylase-like FAD-dependent oxidoreductase